MFWFWFWVVIAMAVIIGVSVLVGKVLSRPARRQLSRHEQMTAFKASGASRHRKSNRE
ncbi:MAG: hypothetical protein AB7O98_14635 [Hyphomonadaceae bacterium]